MIMVDGENGTLICSGNFIRISSEITLLITQICKEAIKQNRMSMKECKEYFVELVTGAAMLAVCFSDDEVESMLKNRAETIFNKMKEGKEWN